MKKILVSMLFMSSLVFALTSAPEKAYQKGRSIASKIDKSIDKTVKVQKCKYYVLVDKSISSKMRQNAYKGCEDETNGIEKK